jgi:ribosomal protein S18 acetylase RimI-like enzyme
MVKKDITKGEIIRDMTVEDVPAVVALDLEVIGLQSPVASSRVVDSYVTGELGLSCVAEIDGKIVGYILGRLAYTPVPVTESAWIQLIGVAPKYRRSGIGKKLINQFHQRCHDKGVKMIHISVPLRDTAVQAFLRNCGFRHTEWAHFTLPLKERS